MALLVVIPAQISMLFLWGLADGQIRILLKRRVARALRDGNPEKPASSVRVE